MIEIPGFEIKSEIGASANANVYLALQISLDYEVALKVMAPALASDSAFSQRFMQEARTLASLAHPHIVAVYDVDIAPGDQHYFSMQYLPGGDFAARVGRGMSDAELKQTLDSVAQALDYVHKRGLVHRDVRPGNILYDASDVPVLTDFGISRAVGANAGSTGTDFSAVSGHYMSPEQARGAKVDARADLYSLGALTYFGLTGKPPYDGPDGFAVAYAHVFEPIPRLPAAQAHWQGVIDRALAKEPAQRFASASEFTAALSEIELPATSTTTEKRAIAETAAQRVEPLASPSPKPAATTPTSPAPVAPKPIDKPAQVPAPVRISRALPQREQSVAAGTAQPSNNRRKLGSLLAIAAAIALCGFTFYSQFGRQRPIDAHPASTVPLKAIAASASAEPAVASTSSALPPAAAAASLAPSASPPAPSASPTSSVTDAALKAAATDATAIPGLDAAAEAAVGEFVPVTDATVLPTVVDPMTEAIRLAHINLAAQRLTSPPGNNALEDFQFLLKRDPKNKIAKQGIVDIAKKYIEVADKSQGSADLPAYLQYLTNADNVAKTLDEGADARKEIATRRAKAAEPYLAQAKAASADWNKAAATAAYEKVVEIDPNNAAARDGLKLAAMIGDPGFVFHDKVGDAGQGPEMIVLGGGRIAAARHDVTRGEFRRFWNAGGRATVAGQEPACRDRESFFRSSRDRTWQNPGFDQDDGHPVVCVSWGEANAYAQWLSRETGKRYRLLTAAEFDQIAGRAAADCNSANIADVSFNKKYDSHDGASCDDGYAATAPANRFEAGSGLFDASGNVRVWIGACGNGSAATAGCHDHMVKGRAWLSAPKESATVSDSFGADVALNSVGFRVVREIEK